MHEEDGQGLSNCPSHLFSPARGTLGLLQTRQNRTPTHCLSLTQSRSKFLEMRASHVHTCTHVLKACRVT